MRPIPMLRSATLSCVVAAESLAAQTLRGRVLDEDTEQPITSAFVVLLDADDRRRDSVLTDAAGVFVFRPQGPGHYRVLARRLGYVRTTTPPLKLKAAETLTVDFLIASAANTLTPVKVLARRGARGPRLQGLEMRNFGARYISRDRINPYRRGARNFADLLRHQNIPGLRIVEDFRGDLCVTVPRSKGQCLDLYLDGSPMSGASVLDPLTIERMVVILPTEAAMRYGMHAPNGILMIYSSRGLPQAEEQPLAAKDDPTDDEPVSPASRPSGRQREL